MLKTERRGGPRPNSGRPKLPPRRLIHMEDKDWDALVKESKQHGMTEGEYIEFLRSDVLNSLGLR